MGQDDLKDILSTVDPHERLRLLRGFRHEMEHMIRDLNKCGDEQEVISVHSARLELVNRLIGEIEGAIS